MLLCIVYMNIIHLTAIFYPILCYLVLIVLLGSRHRLCLYLVRYVSSSLRCCTEGDLKEMKFCGDLSNIYVAIFLMALRCYTKHILSHSTISVQCLAVSTRKCQRIHFYVRCLRCCLIQTLLYKNGSLVGLPKEV